MTGVVVNEKLAVPRKLKKSLRQEVYHLLKHAESHVMKHHSNIQKYLHRLSGKINWVLQVEKNNTEFKNYKTALNSIKSNFVSKRMSLSEACETKRLRENDLITE